MYTSTDVWDVQLCATRQKEEASTPLQDLSQGFQLGAV